jgi:pantoate--beta-alanine ligase
MSSRNQYLTDEERSLAPKLYQALTRAAERLAKGDNDFAAIEKAEFQSIAAAGFRPDYFAIRNAADLTPAVADSRHLVVLLAARLGKARLIDNIQLRR